MDRDDQAWAVFWCSLLSPLLLGEVPEAERETYFRSLAQQERLLPNGRRKRVSVRTLRRWWRRLRDEGVEGAFEDGAATADSRAPASRRCWPAPSS